jgi:hypothetical protein
MHHELLVHDTPEQLGATGVNAYYPPRRHGWTVYRGT